MRSCSSGPWLVLLLTALIMPVAHSSEPAASGAATRIDREEAFSFVEGGARFDVSIEQGPRRATREGIEHWLRVAARAVSGLLGRFPVPSVRVSVKPGRETGDPVLFGQAMRRDGDRLELILCGGACDEDLPGEWIAVHEMTHLAFPRIDPSDAWINEGFVTYYQELLRTRAGFQSEAEGWNQLADGFARGATRGTGRPLEEESREMRRRHAYWRVYWGGAAMALDIDLELRRRTAGRRTLDDVVAYWWRTFGARTTLVRGRDLLDAADAWLGTAILRPIADRHLRRAEFADVEAIFSRLGLAPVGHAVTYLETGPQMKDRARIMRHGGR